MPRQQSVEPPRSAAAVVIKTESDDLRKPRSLGFYILFFFLTYFFCLVLLVYFEHAKSFFVNRF